MEKLKMQTAYMAERNIEMLGQMFPNCLTETINADGKLVRAIDFDKLRQELACEVVEGAEERYQFTWPDKRNAIRLANAPINKTLRPCREESVDFDNTENLYIEGDNLEVLKLLRENYLGKVKMIYIDPPYNTGKDFVYNDDFAQGKAEFEAQSGLFDEEGNRMADPMVQNTESNGRFHTDWLNMIYPRLKVAKDLLSDDGVIFISIDDNELDNLLKVCDEIFGSKNFVSNIVWQKKTGASDAINIAIITENILVYAKNSNVLKLTQNEDAHDSNRYKYKDEFFSDRGAYYYDSLDRGTLGYHEGLDYPVEAPDGTAVYPNGRSAMLNDGWRWKWGKEKLNWGIKNGFIEVRENKSKKNGWGVYYKIYENVDNDGNIIKRSSPYKNLILDVLNTHASAEAKELFGRTDYFSNPKPTRLIKHIINLGTNNNSIILDFFSGSATTAHAVMQLNAEDGGNRKFIMVQLPEKTDEKSEAYKAGYKNICEIGKERIRRAGKKVKDEAGLQGQSLDTGFRVLKLDESNMADVYYTPADTPIQQTLNFDALVDNIREGRTAEDLLFQVLPECNLPLSSKIEMLEIHGKKVFVVNDGYLMACFDSDINDAVITAIAKEKPYYFVMCDRSIASDSVADNFDQIFNVYSKETVRRIL
ncbi:MAG: site-specific DNA-methyltransferase [Paraprevotella sp.]|nr:site-specific DNA-methyltransferase [Paraprevotella sp.]